MIVVNQLSKQIHYKLMQDIMILNTVKVFYCSIWKHHDLFNFITLNYETQFVNHFWNKLCKRLKIQIWLSTMFYSETNNQIKNFNNVLKQYLQAFVTFLQNDWTAWLSSTEFVINNHFFKITQCISFLVNFEQHS